MHPFRPNPIAWMVYLFPGVMAVLYLSERLEPIKLTESTSHGWAITFSILLLVGSLLAMAGSVIGKWRWREEALVLEAIGALLTSAQLGAFAVSLIDAQPPLVLTITLMLCVSTGCLVRAIQIIFEWRQKITLDEVAAEVFRQADQHE